MSFLAEVWEFLRMRKKFWLLPAILLIVATLALLIICGGSLWRTTGFH